jgi:hypothetical protein
MADNKFEEFRELVLSDESLQEALREVTERADFIAKVIELSRKRGYEFSSAEVAEEMRVARQTLTATGI